VILVENCDFFYTTLQSTPPLGGPRRNIGIPFGVKKLEWCGYPMVKKLSICITVSTEYRRETDRRTDKRRRHSPRYA